VLGQLRLALKAPSENEQNNHVTAATENLKALLIELRGKFIPPPEFREFLL